MGYQKYKKGVIHRRVELRPVGADGAAVKTAAFETGPAVIRFIGVDYQNQPATTDLIVKADNASGDTLLTLANTNTDVTPRPISLTAGVDETGAALAATDGSAGGLPVARGLYFDVAQADGQTSGNEVIYVDIWYDAVKFDRVDLVPLGADGSATVTQTRRYGNAGVIRAIKVDYQNQPATCDLTITADPLADGSGGQLLFTRTDSGTDIAVSPVGMAGGNETNAALAATDASDGGWPFKGTLKFVVAQGDGGGTDKIVVDLWID